MNVAPLTIETMLVLPYLYKRPFQEAVEGGKRGTASSKIWPKWRFRRWLKPREDSSTLGWFKTQCSKPYVMVIPPKVLLF